jgi:hypothetical protein
VPGRRPPGAACGSPAGQLGTPGTKVASPPRLIAGFRAGWRPRSPPRHGQCRVTRLRLPLVGLPRQTTERTGGYTCRPQASWPHCAMRAGRIRSRIGTALSARLLFNLSKGWTSLLTAGCRERTSGRPRRNAGAATRVPASPVRTGRDRWVPVIPPGEAPSDHRRQRPPRPGCLIPCHHVSPVSLPGAREACFYYTTYYSIRNARALSHTGKGL